MIGTNPFDYGQVAACVVSSLSWRVYEARPDPLSLAEHHRPGRRRRAHRHRAESRLARGEGGEEGVAPTINPHSFAHRTVPASTAGNPANAARRPRCTSSAVQLDTAVKPCFQELVGAEFKPEIVAERFVDACAVLPVSRRNLRVPPRGKNRCQGACSSSSVPARSRISQPPTACTAWTSLDVPGGRSEGHSADVPSTVFASLFLLLSLCIQEQASTTMWAAQDVRLSSPAKLPKLTSLFVGFHGVFLRRRSLRRASLFLERGRSSWI